MTQKNYTRLLNRQIRKYAQNAKNSEELTTFYEKVNDSYTFYEQDRILLERAMEINSDELSAKNNELVKVNNSLLISRERYRNLLEHNHVGIIAIDESAKITLLNEIFSKYLGYQKSEIIGKSIDALVPDESSEKINSLLSKLMKGEIKHFTIENRFITSSDEIVFAYSKFFGAYNKKGQFINATATILDVTKNKKAETILFENILALENLDRERLAYLLHEGIGQNIATAQLKLQEFATNASDSNCPNAELINSVKQILNDTIKEVRNISYKIIPEHVTKFGFITSLRSMVEDLNSKFKTPVFNFYTNINHEIYSTNTQLTLYRIIQEAVNNILKHADAKNASIQLTQTGKSISLLIEDDGIGFNSKETLEIDNSTTGLKSIISRAKSINGDILIESRISKGTTITIHFFIN